MRKDCGRVDPALAKAEPVARLDPPGFDPERGGVRPLREFINEIDAQLRAEQGWLRYWWNKSRAIVMVRWRLRLHYWLHPEALRYVSPEAFAAFTPEDIAETRAAIAMEAQSVETHPKDDSAGREASPDTTPDTTGDPA